MKQIMTATALCAAALIGMGTGLGAADISAAESWNSSYGDDSGYGYSGDYSSNDTAPPPPTTEPVLNPVENPVFADIVEMYRKNVSENWTNYKGKTATGILNTKELDTVSSEWLTTYKDYPLSRVGYSIDNNHLFIFAGGSEIIESYSYDNGIITHLFSDTEKAIFYYKHIWINDNKGEYGLTSESGSTLEPISAFWEIQDGNLILTKAYKDFEYSSGMHIAKSFCAQPEMLEDGTITGEWEPCEEQMPMVTSLGRITSLSQVAPLTSEPVTEPTEPPAEPEPPLGDIDGTGTVNASDAANVLIAAAAIGASKDPGLTDAQRKAADVNSDTAINATDAAIILQYAAAVGAGHTDAQITDFVNKS